MDRFPTRASVDRIKTEVFQVEPRFNELNPREWIYIGWNKEQGTYTVALMFGPATPNEEAQMLTYYMHGKWHDTDNYPQEQEDHKEVEAV